MELAAQVPLSRCTTFRLGGPARFFVSVTSLPELREALAYARERSLRVLVMGGGSNLLVTDEGWPGLVIQIAIKGREYDEAIEGDARLIASAGEDWDSLVQDTVTQGLWGLENLSRIPGTVGATPVQNVGAYGVEVKDHIEWVEALNTKTDGLEILSNSACKFGYRDSLFKSTEGRHYIVTRVAFRLKTKPLPRLEYKDLKAVFGERTDVPVEEVRKAVCEIRDKKFPNMDKVGTAGSFFKNPIIERDQYEAIQKWAPRIPAYVVDDAHVKVPAAWLLDQLGYKGLREGSVGCHDAQPLVLVYYGNGCARDMIFFARDIMRRVKEKFDITLEPEVRIIHTSQQTT
jgi:UDP-N-acetylmuramate dehydrogenase